MFELEFSMLDTDCTIFQPAMIEANKNTSMYATFVFRKRPHDIGRHMASIRNFNFEAGTDFIGSIHAETLYFLCSTVQQYMSIKN